MKHQFHNSIIFWSIAKKLHICYFEYFSHAWSCPLRMKTSFYRKLLCSSTQKFNFFTHFFPEISQNICKLCFFRIIYACLAMPTEINGLSLWESLMVIHMQNNKLPPSFLRHCKDILNLLFWVIWAYLAVTSKNAIVS